MSSQESLFDADDYATQGYAAVWYSKPDPDGAPRIGDAGRVAPWRPGDEARNFGVVLINHGSQAQAEEGRLHLEALLRHWRGAAAPTPFRITDVSGRVWTMVGGDDCLAVPESTITHKGPSNES